MNKDIITLYCKIVAIEIGLYTNIVIEDLNRSYSDDLKYITIVKLPNWGKDDISIDDIGYIQFQYVEAGISKWFNKDDKKFEVYNYDNYYFINFFKEKEKVKQDKFEFY